jgi:hypothetical protein
MMGDKTRICKTKCNQCLYTKNRVVGAERATELMRETLRKDTNFICHKSQLRGEKNEAFCAGSVDQSAGQLVRIMGRLGGIEYIDPETGEVIE